VTSRRGWKRRSEGGDRLQVDREPDLGGDQKSSRRSEPGPLSDRSRVLVLARIALQDAPRRLGRAGARGLGHHGRRETLAVERRTRCH